MLKGLQLLSRQYQLESSNLYIWLYAVRKRTVNLQLIHGIVFAETIGCSSSNERWGRVWNAPNEVSKNFIRQK